MNFLSLLLPFLSSLPGAVGEFFKQKNEIEKVRLNNYLQIEVAKSQMATEIAKAEVDRAKSALSATGQYFKYFTFFMWFGPFMVGVLFPNFSKDIFENLRTMPEWYTQSCLLIMFTVWGITVSAPAVSNIFSGLSSFMSQRRDYKLAKIDRKLYYETLRQTKGFVSPDDVKEMEPVFDVLDKDTKNG